VNYLFSLGGFGPYTMMDNLFGTMVGYATLTLPLVLLLQIFSLSFIDRRLIEASYNLGANAMQTLFAVIIPAARVGLVLAAAFAFVLSFGDFVAPTMIGGNRPPVMSTVLVDQIRAGNHWPRASVVAITMFTFLFSVVACALWFAYRPAGSRR
jgi:spermidine/putrescine transport system permease protein